MSAIDPFAALVSEPAAFEESKPVEQNSAVVGTVKTSRSLFVFDFETVPDESRFPRPEPEPVPEKVVIADRTDCEIDKVIKGTVSAVVKEVKQGFSDRQLKQLLDEEKAQKKPRGGVIDAINKALVSDDSAAQEVSDRNDSAFAAWRKEGSVSPLRARIVAFGWAFQDGEVQSLTATNDDEERALLEQFWTLIKTTRRRCGYNIFHFDDFLAVVRSLLLGVDIPRPLDRRRYGNREAVDLMVALFPSGKSEKCKDVVRLFGIEPPAGEVDGSDVFEMFEDGDLKAISEYVRSDVHVERELYLLLADGFVM